MNNNTKRLGILGGGQLGRMLAIAAHSLGIQVVIFSDQPNSPASYVTNKTIVADYHDKNSLIEFANCVDVVTLEYENIPTDTLNLLSRYVSVYPDSKALEITQDRLLEKRFIKSCGLVTTEFEEITNVNNINLDYPFIIKTLREGYDGKGQCRVYSNNDKINIEPPFIAEKVVNFEKEISIIAARDLYGAIEFFPIPKNTHNNGILITSSVPADISNHIIKEAQDIAIAILEKMNYIGIITVELFLTAQKQLLVNEIAPRVHNSGHWSVESCNISQFEQHVRAVCGLPIKPVHLYFSCEMHNLIGDDIKSLNKSPAQKVTIYGKEEIRKGRKMGHFTIPTL